jgi:hypothetical protein
MEEQEHLEKKKPSSTHSSPRKKMKFGSLSASTSKTLSVGKKSVSLTGLNNIIKKTRHKKLLLTPFPYLLIPHPFYFTSIKHAQRYIDDLTCQWNKNINYQDEDGKACAHYVFNLNNQLLFEKPLFKKEKTGRVQIEEGEETEEKENKGDNERNIGFRPLPPDHYFVLQYQFMELLLKRKDVDFTLQDNGHDTPFTYLIRSLLDETIESENIKIQQAQRERLCVKKAYIPKIFQLILYYGYHSVFKKELFSLYPLGSPDLEYIKHLLSPTFPLYLYTPSNIKEFMRKKLSKQELVINTQDQNGMTIMHYLLCLNEELTLNTRNLEHTAQLFRHICTNYRPNLTLRNTMDLSPIDCLFSSLINFKPESDGSPASLILISSQRSSEISYSNFANTQPIPTKKQTPLRPIVKIVQLIMKICPQFFCNTFNNQNAHEKYHIQSFISFFPILIKVKRLNRLCTTKRRTSIKKIFEAVDTNNGNNYAHYLADLSNQLPLFENTPDNRLKAITCILNHEQGETLACQKNNDGKLPLEVFLDSCSHNVFHYAIDRDIYKNLVFTLAQFIHGKEDVQAALESSFPFFMTTQQLAKKLNEFETSRLDMVDNNGNTVLHCLANPSNKHILLYNTPENRLASIGLIFKKKNDKSFACHINNGNKLPLDLLIQYLCTIDQDDSDMHTYQKIMAILLQKTIDEKDNNYLHHLAQLIHENCLKFISFMSQQEQHKELACQKNSSDKLPLELLFESFFSKPIQKKDSAENFRMAVIQLAKPLDKIDLATIINKLSLKDFRDFRKIIGGHYHTHEKDTVELLRSIVNFRSATLQK